MARPSDWSSLGLTGDPTSGDAASIRGSARELRAVATSITEQANRLKKLSSSDGWDSESGEEFHSAAGALAGAIEKAKGRYEGVGDALATYANELETVQHSADTILAAADQAEDDKREAQHRVLPGDKGSPEYVAAELQQTKDVQKATAAVNKARQDIANLTGSGGEWHRINEKAAASIRDASDDELTDQFFDGFKAWVHSIRGILNTIKDILAVVGTILAVIVLVAALFVPGANVAALILLGVIISGVTLAITAAQAVAGDASGEDVAWAAFGLVTSLIGLKAAGPLESLGGRLGNSVSHSVGQTTRLAGGSYSAGYSTTRALATGIERSAVVTMMDEKLLGGAMKLTGMYLLAPEANLATGLYLQGLKLAIPLGILHATETVHTYGFERPEQFREFEKVTSSGSDGGSGGISGIANAYWAEKTKIEIGSL